MNARVSIAAILALSSLVALTGTTCPTRNRGHGTGALTPVEPTIANVWPNEDGRSWTFRELYREWPWDIPPTAEDPSSLTLPTLDEVAALLDTLRPGAGPDPVTFQYRLRFNGEITTQSGVTAQNLEFSFPPALPAPATLAGPPGSAFLAELSRARPDLRARIEARLGASPARTADHGPPAPLLVHGYAWRLTRNWIGTYGDLDTLLAWKFVSGDLRPGAEFTFQLVPSLADDVFLHAKVRREREVETPGGTVERAVEVVYLIDYGMPPVVDVGSSAAGFLRAYSIGSVTYAPEVGPVESRERRLLWAGPEQSIGCCELTLKLLQTAPPPALTRARRTPATPG